MGSTGSTSTTTIQSPEQAGSQLADDALIYFGSLVTNSTASIKSDIMTTAVVASQSGVAVGDAEVSTLVTKAIGNLPSADQDFANIVVAPYINPMINAAITKLVNFGIGKLFGSTAESAAQQVEIQSGNPA